MKKIVLLLVITTLVVIDLQSQCSMCSAAVESNQKTGEEIAEGLNAGILYLMGIPYAAIVGLGILLFRKRNKGDDDDK